MTRSSGRERRSTLVICMIHRFCRMKWIIIRRKRMRESIRWPGATCTWWTIRKWASVKQIKGWRVRGMLPRLIKASFSKPLESLKIWTCSAADCQRRTMILILEWSIRMNMDWAWWASESISWVPSQANHPTILRRCLTFRASRALQINNRKRNIMDRIIQWRWSSPAAAKTASTLSRCTPNLFKTSMMAAKSRPLTAGGRITIGRIWRRRRTSNCPISWKSGPSKDRIHTEMDQHLWCINLIQWWIYCKIRASISAATDRIPYLRIRLTSRPGKGSQVFHEMLRVRLRIRMRRRGVSFIRTPSRASATTTLMKMASKIETW